ncbi:hypothetical protein FGIG_09817, partial [Fasciola gigantica]
PGRYQHAEVTCLTDFTAPRLVLYTYKSTRWPFTVQRMKTAHLQSTDHASVVTCRQRVIRMEAQMHGLDDLFHVAQLPASDDDRWAKRARLQLGRWLGWITSGRQCEFPREVKRDSSGFDDISLTDASQLAIDCPVKPTRADAPVDSTDRLSGRSLMLYLESGETCMLRLDAGSDRGQCLRALHNILNKNKLLRGYPDIDHAWTVTVRYKIRTSQIPRTSLLASGFTNTIGRRFLCLTVSEFLIVQWNLRQPEVVCPYSFVRQCASRRDGQFRLFLGRASPLGECEVILQMSNATIARSAHEKFVRLMNQSGARYERLRCSFVDNLNTEFTKQFPRLPRPSTVIHTTTNTNTTVKLTESRRNRVSFGTSSTQSGESKQAPVSSKSNTRSWDTLSRGTTQAGPEAILGTNQTWLCVRRVKSFDQVELFRARTIDHPQIHSRRRSRSMDERMCMTVEEYCSPGSTCPSVLKVPLTETRAHYVEMTDRFDTSENPPHQLTPSGHSDQGSSRPRNASSSSGIEPVQVTLRNRSHVPWPIHRSPPRSSMSVASTTSTSNRPSRPVSHRGDDTLFADVVCDPQSQASSFMKPMSKTRRSLTLLNSDSVGYNRSTNRRYSVSTFSCGTHPRLRAMSDVTTTWGRSVRRPVHHKLPDPHPNHLLHQPVDTGSRSNIEGQNLPADWRLSSASFLSSPVVSSARSSCTAAGTTPASCSNLKHSQELLQILEVGYEDHQDATVQSRPRAHTVGSSLLVGPRLAAVASTCNPLLITAPRRSCVPRVDQDDPKKTVHDLKQSDYASDQPINAAREYPSLTLSFADHYAL